jgi:hypothetical protein
MKIKHGGLFFLHVGHFKAKMLGFKKMEWKSTPGTSLKRSLLTL